MNNYAIKNFYFLLNYINFIKSKKKFIIRYIYIFNQI